jgi:hypothetical protein
MWNNYDLRKQNLLLVRMKFLLVDWTFRLWGCALCNYNTVFVRRICV